MRKSRGFTSRRSSLSTSCPATLRPEKKRRGKSYKQGRGRREKKATHAGDFSTTKDVAKQKKKGKGQEKGGGKENSLRQLPNITVKTLNDERRGEEEKKRGHRGGKRKGGEEKERSSGLGTTMNGILPLRYR